MGNHPGLPGRGLLWGSCFGACAPRPSRRPVGARGILWLSLPRVDARGYTLPPLRGWCCRTSASGCAGGFCAALADPERRSRSSWLPGTASRRGHSLRHCPGLAGDRHPVRRAGPDRGAETAGGRDAADLLLAAHPPRSPTTFAAPPMSRSCVFRRRSRRKDLGADSSRFDPILAA